MIVRTKVGVLRVSWLSPLDQRVVRLLDPQTFMEVSGAFGMQVDVDVLEVIRSPEVVGA